MIEYAALGISILALALACVGGFPGLALLAGAKASIRVTSETVSASPTQSVLTLIDERIKHHLRVGGLLR
jgi:hypothetical protein